MEDSFPTNSKLILPNFPPFFYPQPLPGKNFHLSNYNSNRELLELELEKTVPLIKKGTNYANVSVDSNLRVELSMLRTFNLDVYYKQILEILRSPNFADQRFSMKGGESGSLHF